MEVEELITEIGTYPETWSIDRVDSVFDLIQGKQVSERNRIGDNQRPFLRTKNVFWNRLELAELDQMHFSTAEEARYTLLPGDLLLCEGGDVGRTAMWRGEVERCYIQNHLHRLRAFDGMVDPQYAVFWFWYAFNVGNLYIGRGNKTTIPNMSRSKLAELQIALPPLPEQQRIAQVLSTVQEAIAQQERLIRTTTELKQALMQKLFTEGLRGEALKETEVGRVPESWEVVKLEDLADVRSGKRLPKGNALVAEDTGYPYIRVTDFEDNSVLTQQLLFVPTHIQPRIQRYIIEKDDVYISVAGSIGIVGMIPEELDGANLTENANRLVIRNKKRIEPRYLMYWLDSDRCQHEIKAQTLKNAQPKLALGRIKTLAVALPSIEEQKDMVLALDAVRTKRQVAERKTKTLQDLFRTLLHELMTGKVRVGES
ncbi:MAG: restriction endonuclease subunit S [Flavobacteriales bacterium]|nr:restriction endonuclease subunit S [Flavobacteriales bacterium]